MPAKSGFPLKRASLLLLLMLTGCALRVPVRQLRLPDKLPPEELGALKAIYLVLRLADAETASADKLARAVGLAAEIRRAVEGPSSRVVAYQITASDEPADYFIAQSSATGVLWLNLPATEPDPPPQEVGDSTATASARPVEASLKAPYH
ncbi:MAG: hypothetical protein HY611_07710 [Elusimicrobia bacterium]|nr:hypothetical protein [Elusimicrobiota bacterium]